MICKDTEIWKYKSWLAQMKGWKDKILFAKIQRCQKITDGLQKIKRYKTASKTYTTETAHQAERMHDHDVSWKFIRVNQCIWNFIWSEKRFFESIDVSGKCVDISEKKNLLILRQDLSARNVLLALPNYYVFMQETQVVERQFQIMNSFAGRYLSLRRVI